MKKPTTFFSINSTIKAALSSGAILLFIFSIFFSSCEKRELVSPQNLKKRGDFNYLQSTYDSRQEGSAVLEELGISDESDKNVSFSSGNQSSATDKDDDDENGSGNGDDENGSGNDDEITDKDGDDDEDGESSSD
jgi:hypothetical protein